MLQGVYFCNNYSCLSFSEKKKKKSLCFSIHLLLRWHLTNVAITWHKTPNWKIQWRKKKNYFMVPNQHQRTQLLLILPVLRAYCFQHTYWQIETRIFKAGIILEDPVTVFIELRIQMFDRLPSHGVCYLQAANAYWGFGSLKELYLWDSFRAKREPNLRMSWSSKNKPHYNCTCFWTSPHRRRAKQPSVGWDRQLTGTETTTSAARWLSLPYGELPGDHFSASGQHRGKWYS